MKTIIKKTIATIIIISCTFLSFSQGISVDCYDRVGVGSITPSSSYYLNVGGNASQVNGIYYSKSNLFIASTNWGIVSSQTSSSATEILRSIYGVAYVSSPQNSGQAYGVHGVAGNCTNGYNVGVFGQLQGSRNGTAVYGQVGTGYLANIDDMNGLQLKSYPIQTKGNGSIIINASELQPGIYIYSLITDGQLIDTKRMIITD